MGRKRNFRHRRKQHTKKRRKIDLAKLGDQKNQDKSKKRFQTQEDSRLIQTKHSKQVYEADFESEEETTVSSYQQLLTTLGKSAESSYKYSDEDDSSEDDDDDIPADDKVQEGIHSEEDRNGEPEDDDRGEDDDIAEDASGMNESDIEKEDEIDSDRVEENDLAVEDGEQDGSDSDGEDELEDDDESVGEEEDAEENTGEMNFKDLFFRRLNHDIGDKMASKLGEGKVCSTSEVKWPSLGVLRCASLSDDPIEVTRNRGKNLHDLCVRKRIADQWESVNQELVEDEDQVFTPYQQEMFSIMNAYKDMLYTERSHKNEEELRNTYCLHILNHIIKSRSTVLKHNSLLSADPSLESETMRDQGLTRPRVLIVVPFRNDALRIVNTFIKLLETKGTTQHVSHRKRFQEEYSEMEEYKSKISRPDDWEAMFAGNSDDHFRLGIALSRKNLRLYTKFYMSDIIIASPLGLRTVIGTKGEKQDYDFLSSIEILLMDKADVFLMQNWEHITHLMYYMHLQPQESHGVDFSRVRMWALNKWNKFYRQTVILSGVALPELSALFNRHCYNYAGRITVHNPPTNGSICQVVTQLPQIFHKVECGSFADAAQNRFDFFVKKILPQFKDSIMSGTMIYVSSYFDFVRIRNYFRKQDIQFAQICEYTSQSNISRARQYMFKGHRHFLVYTERFHFYRRYKLRGIRNIIFYQLPSYPQYYSELCNMLDSKRGTVTEHTCMVLYSRYDAHRLAATLGTERCSHMLSSDKGVHMLVSGESR